MKKRSSTIILIIILIAGLSLLLYPTVSNYWNSFHQTRAIDNYEEQVEEMEDEDRQEILDKAQAYNQALWTKENHYVLNDEEKKEYEEQLNISGTGMMGYIEIPRINSRMPIYHGVDEKVLQVAVGHLEGSSLPVGGEGTHSVLTAHRGLPSAELFTNLDKMAEGDIFVIRILNETLTYEVDQIRIVLPEEVNNLELEEGKDYCTLVTCTPYGINTHRMLIRGHRTSNREDNLSGEAEQYSNTLVAFTMSVPMLAVLFIGTMFSHRKAKDIVKE